MYLRGLVHIASVRQLLNQVILNNKLNSIIANDIISQVLEKRHLQLLLHLHSYHLGAHGLRLFVHLYYNYAHVTSNCDKNKQYAMSHRQVA